MSVDAPVFALTHVRVINGTAAPPRENQTILVESGTIRAMGNAGDVSLPAGVKVIDLSGSTVIPGLIGMHDHLFYPIQFSELPLGAGIPTLYGEMGLSFPRLYLAGGVTSIRTTGSIEPYTDLGLKKMIDEGQMPGPKMHITGPYLEGSGAFTPQMHELSGPDDARKSVDYWAGEGVTSFKAYMHITRAELKAAIDAAHARRLKITGHLCSIGFREAAALGIDNLEHGLMEDTEFVPGKKPDTCPSPEDALAALDKLDIEAAPVQDMIHDLVQHHVAVTSTLPLYETSVLYRPPLDRLARVMDVLAPEAAHDYTSSRVLLGMYRSRGDDKSGEEFSKEMQFEHDFAKAGGLLLAGEDPTGSGGILAGFGDQREIELLVEAGFAPVEALHIATANGAAFLGDSDRIGTLAPGKIADMVVIKGNPAQHIDDIEKVETVFKDSVGYDPARLIESVRGLVGRR